jgi:hypothetical protein
MFWGFNYTRLLLGSLLVLHVLWIGTHLYLVKNHQLNAWKLGGYGMYTRPSPRFRLNAHVEGLEASEKWQSNPKFSAENWYFVLPCRPISASRIASFYQDNPEALGKTTHLLITIRSFERYPVKSEYLPRVELTIRWPDDKTFTWEGKVCEQQSKGKGQWPH